ncbi:MAG: response regulator [Alphaproteobacteria bacterium]|nr:response regulator [Alphaproteobacteria bacterium]
MNATVLVVEDDRHYRETLGRRLRRSGYRVTLVAGLTEARGAIAALPPDLALIDLKLEDGDGLAVLKVLADKVPACRAIMLTGHGTIPDAVEAMRLGAVDFRTKPVSGHEIIQALRDALEPLPMQSLERVERDHILSVLHACGGNISEAARRLGLHRRTLQRKLQKLPPAR